MANSEFATDLEDTSCKLRCRIKACRKHSDARAMGTSWAQILECSGWEALSVSMLYSILLANTHDT